MPHIDLRKNKVEIAMIETVRKNFEYYTKKNIENSKLSCTVQSMIGHPPNEHCKQSVSPKHLKQCPIDINDIKNDKAIFRPDWPGLKGWST